MAKEHQLYDRNPKLRICRINLDLLELKWQKRDSDAVPLVSMLPYKMHFLKSLIFGSDLSILPCHIIVIIFASIE